MATRQKKRVITGVTREQAEEAFAAYAKSDAESSKIAAEIELQCARIREKYQDRLALLVALREKLLGHFMQDLGHALLPLLEIKRRRISQHRGLTGSGCCFGCFGRCRCFGRLGRYRCLGCRFCCFYFYCICFVCRVL